MRKNDNRDRDDTEALLAQVERALGDTTTRRPGRAGPPSAAPRRGGLRRATVSASIAAGVVWVLFALLPFLGATSGAAGAFLAAFVTVLVLGARRR